MRRTVALLAATLTLSSTLIVPAVSAEGETSYLPGSEPSQITFSYDAENVGPVSARFN